MRPKIAAINLSTPGQVIIPGEHATVIVGPNNAGKSAILTGILNELSGAPGQLPGPQPGPIGSVVVEMPAEDDFLAALEARAEFREQGAQQNGSFLNYPSFVFSNGLTIAQHEIATLQSRTSHFGSYATSMVLFLGPEGRGGVLNSHPLPDLMSTSIRSPMQLLWGDRALEREISDYMWRAFDRKLLVNRHAGANIHLHIGDVGIAEPRVGDKSEYLTEVMKLPLLSTQGSGVQAFMGTILSLATGMHDIVLLDEPEAFLHPPQARLLGEVVVEMSRTRGVQVVVSTHSDDFLQGIIGASRDDAESTIVRLTRPGDHENRIAQIEPDSIKILYRDPLLRYSSVMNGIFYKGVVVCEAESDCTFYAATLGYVEEVGDLSSTDVLFTQCGGKDRFGRAYQALNAAAVPTAIIADIDLLSDKAKFSDLFTTMGGDFSSIEASYNVLEASVRSRRRDPDRSAVRRDVLAVLDNSDRPVVSRTELDQIREIIKSESGWKHVKRGGVSAIDSGGPSAAFETIAAEAKGVGLFILRVGELERFRPTIPGNKQGWLREVLEKELYREEGPAAHLLRDVREYIRTHQ